MLTMYVVLDGFDLGAGAVHLLVARTEAERRMVLRAHRPGVGRQRGVADRRRGHAVLRLPQAVRVELQRLLPAAHDGAMAAHPPGASRSSFAVTCENPLWTPVLGRGLRRRQPAAHRVLRRRARQRGAGRAPRRGRLLLRPLWTNFSAASASASSTGSRSSWRVQRGRADHHGTFWVAPKRTTPAGGHAAAARIWPRAPGAWRSDGDDVPHPAARARPAGGAPPGLCLPALALAGLVGRPRMRRAEHYRRFLASATYLLGMLLSAPSGCSPSSCRLPRVRRYGLTLQAAVGTPNGLEPACGGGSPGWRWRPATPSSSTAAAAGRWT